jgi:hypothetical protein
MEVTDQQMLNRHCPAETNYVYMDASTYVMQCGVYNNTWTHTINLITLFFHTLYVILNVKVMLQLTISRSVCLGVEAHLGLMTGY